MIGPEAVGLALSTLVSEDVASIAAGLLARDGRLPLAHAVTACVVGVYAGDLALWVLGRALGSGITRIPWLGRRLDMAALAVVGARIDRHLASAVIVSRFVPGSRLPMYLAAGIWSRRPLAFAWWSLVAVVAWTPLLVVSTAYFGNTAIAGLLRGVELGVAGSLVTGGVMLLVVRAGGRAATAAVRRYHQRFDQTIERPAW